MVLGAMGLVRTDAAEEVYESPDASDLPTGYQRDILAYWHRCRGEASCPSVTRIDPTEMPRAALPMMAIVAVRDGIYEGRVFGTRLTQLIGYEPKGMIVNDSPGAASAIARFDRCVETRIPYFVRTWMRWFKKDHLECGVMTMPFEEADRVTRLMCVFNLPKFD